MITLRKMLWALNEYGPLVYIAALVFMAYWVLIPVYIAGM